MPTIEAFKPGEREETMEKAVSTEETSYRWVILMCAFLLNCFFNAFNLGAMAPLLPEIAEELNLTHTQLGIIWGALPLGIVLFSVIGGNLADRFGVKRVITQALIFGAIFCVARALFPSFWGLSVAMFFLGVSQAFVIPNLTKAIGQWFGSAELGIANGFLIVGIGTGVAIGSMLAASVLSPLLGGWKGVMWLTGGITLGLLGMWIILAKEQQPAQTTREQWLQQPGFLDSLTRLFRIREIWLLAIIESCIVGAGVAWIGMFPDILVSKGMSAGAAGFFVSIGMWAAALSGIMGPYFSDRFGIRKLFIWISLIIHTVSLSLQGFLMGVPLAYMIALAGMCRGTITPLIRTITLEIEGVRPQLGGSAIGIMFTANRLGGLVWPIAMGALIDYTGLYWPPLMLLSLLSLIALGLIIFVEDTGPKHALARQLANK